MAELPKHYLQLLQEQRLATTTVVPTAYLSLDDKKRDDYRSSNLPSGVFNNDDDTMGDVREQLNNLSLSSVEGDRDESRPLSTTEHEINEDLPQSPQQNEHKSVFDYYCSSRSDDDDNSIKGRPTCIIIDNYILL